MKLKLFNGGLNTRQDSKLIAPNEAVECENVDTSSGIIKSAKGLVESNITATYKPVYYEYQSKWVDITEMLESLQYQKKMYWTTSTKAQKYNGTTQQNLGIEAPKQAVRVKSFDTLATIPTTITLTGKNYTYDTVLTYEDESDGQANSFLRDVVVQLFVYDDPFSDGELSIVQSFKFKVNIPNYKKLIVTLNGSGGTASCDFQVFVIYSAPPSISRWNFVNNTSLPTAGTDKYWVGSWSDYWEDIPIFYGHHTLAQLETDKTYYIAGAVESSDGLNMSVLKEGSFAVTGNVKGIQVDIVAEANVDVHFYLKAPDGLWYLWESGLTDGSGDITRTLFGDWTYEVRNIEDIVVDEDTGKVTIHLDRTMPYQMKGNYCYVGAISGMDELNGKNFRTDETNSDLKTIVLQTLDIEPEYVNGKNYNDYAFGGHIYTKLYQQAGITGIYQYIYTYYNADDGTESQASPENLEIDVPSNSVVNLEFIDPPTDTQVTHIRLYRIGVNLLSHTLVDEFPIRYFESTPDTLVTPPEYKDFKQDESLPGFIYNAGLNAAPPTGLQYLKQIYGVFLGAVENKLYFSRDIGNPNYWPQAYYVNFPTTITGIGITGSRIVIFTKYKTYGLTGSSARNFSKYGISGDQGCINHDTLVEKGNTLLYISSDGLCALSGSTVQLISKMKLGKQTFNTVNAVIHDEVYYLQLTNGKILAFDFRYEPCIKYYDFGTDYLVVGEDVLYGRKGGKLHKLFEGDEVAFTYTTGRMTDGGDSEIKTYDKFYVSSEGDVTMEIFITGESKKTKKLNELRNKLREITVSQSSMLGYDVQIKFTGIGSVTEVEYKAGDRENGK